MKNKKTLLLVSVLLVILLLIVPVTAFGDAGNFAGGSDWDFSGSDFGGGWDSDYSDYSDYDDDHSSGFPVFIGGIGGDDDDDGGGGFFIYVIIAVIVVVFLVNLRKQKKGGSSGSRGQSMRAADNASIQKLLQNDPHFSIQKFSEDASNLYVRLQNAWQEKDLSPVRSNMTDNLYAQFERQLQPYINNRQTNHVDNIAVLRAALMSYRQDDVNDILTIDLHTRIIDYVTDDTTGQLIRGSMSKELFMGYEYTFIRTKGVKTGQTVNADSTCPNCGAPLDINHSGKCPYCDSVLSRAEYTWALASIKGLYQRSK